MIGLPGLGRVAGAL